MSSFTFLPVKTLLLLSSGNRLCFRLLLSLETDLERDLCRLRLCECGDDKAEDEGLQFDRAELVLEMERPRLSLCPFRS